jgi:hypothetical protein
MVGNPEVTARSGLLGITSGLPVIRPQPAGSAIGNSYNWTSRTEHECRRTDRSPHLNRRVFFIGVSALAAARTFDAIETRRVLDRGGSENNPVFGRRPSPTRQGLINVAFFAGESFLFYKTERSNKWYLRWAGRINLSFTTEEHLRYGACGAAMRKCLGNGLF